MATASSRRRSSKPPEPINDLRKGQPVWELAMDFPLQGEWTEEQYLTLGSRCLIEFDNGFLEFLPVPTIKHGRLARMLLILLEQAAGSEGDVLAAPTPIPLWPKKYREPDVLFCRPERTIEADGQPQGADLVIEIVSEGRESRQRALVTKRKEYAKAQIDEYWIVDPEQGTVTVLVRSGRTYRTHGTFGAGQVASSVLLPGFVVKVTELFAAGESHSAHVGGTRAANGGKKARGGKEA